MIDMPKNIWIEPNREADDACDVIVEMENGQIYTAPFITIPFLQRQMQLSYAVCKQLPDNVPVKYATLDTPHVVVENLERDTIEDTVDNLIAQDVFESVFTLVNDSDDEPTRTTGTGKRATTEVAAVVLTEVLVMDR